MDCRNCRVGRALRRDDGHRRAALVGESRHNVRQPEVRRTIWWDSLRIVPIRSSAHPTVRCFLLLLCLVACPAAAADTLLRQVGVERGICAVAGMPEGGAAAVVDLARDSPVDHLLSVVPAGRNGRHVARLRRPPACWAGGCSSMVTHARACTSPTTSPTPCWWPRRGRAGRRRSAAGSAPGGDRPVRGGGSSSRRRRASTHGATCITRPTTTRSRPTRRPARPT